MKRIPKIQILRALSLFSVIAFFVFIPLSNWYANFKISYNNSRLVGLSDGKTNSIIYHVLDWFYSFFEDPVIAATSNNGSLWAYTIFGVPISDPLGLLSEIISSVHFPIKYFLGGLIPYILAIILGRFFCAWLCPMVIINAICRPIRKLLLYFHVPLLNIKIPIQTRAIVFFGGLILSYFFGMWTWHFILPYISLTHEIFSLIIFQSLTIGAYFLLAIILFEIAVIPGQFCKSICPTGYLLSVIGKIRFVRLKTNSAKCPQGCHNCYDACPINLYPKDNKLSSCHLCMKCISSCPIKNINITANLKHAPVEKNKEK
ncbi:MAG: hypothetical protein H6584_05685 [Flavobacteriales bacterium]|nr:hypothetical protein [Flavobacteriales bacterium]